MKLLLTNDDGIAAPGLAALETAGRALGTPIVVAPHQPLSGCSHLTTTDRPLFAQRAGAERFSLDGAPADCVRIGLLQLAQESEWVLAGINDGGNLGVDIYMSGTVAAAREAALLGRKAIALSHYRLGRQPVDWQRAAEWATEILRQLIDRPVTEPGYWNVNLPDPVDSSARPRVVFCRPDPHPLPVVYERREDRFYYTSNYHHRRREPASDVDVCFSGNIAVSFVPLQCG